MVQQIILPLYYSLHCILPVIFIDSRDHLESEPRKLSKYDNIEFKKNYSNSDRMMSTW